MALHFSIDEFSERRSRLIALLEERGLDGLLIFRQESMYYLTGYDSFGYVFFQCMFLSCSGDIFLLTRSADLRQALHTSILGESEIYVWVDGEGADPSIDLRDLLSERGMGGKSFGVEYLSYGLSSYLGKRLDSALSGFCDLEDASYLVSRLRSVKSSSELEYVRIAASLADDAWDSAYGVFSAGAGVDEGDILAAQQGAIFAGGGDYSGNEFVIASGDDALLCRSKSGRRRLSVNDQLTLEWAGVYRHYHAAMMRTVVFGEVSDLQVRMHGACCEALFAIGDALRPGETCGFAFDEHARIFDSAGFGEHRLHACGYSMGTTFAPNWMDFPHLYHGSGEVIQSGMVFFCHMILMNSVDRLAMCYGHTFLIGDKGAESLSRVPLDFVNIS